MSYIQSKNTSSSGHKITTWCQCWKMKCRNGTITGYTDHDRPLTIDNILYEAHAGFNASETKRSLGFAVSTVDIEGALSSYVISVEDISKGVLDGATIETFLVDWRSSTFLKHIGSWVIGKIKRQDGRFIAELESPMHSLDQPNGRYLMRSCDAELGDARCCADLSNPSRKARAIVSSIEGQGLIGVDGLEGFSAGWFSHGILIWETKNLSKKTNRVSHHFFRNNKAYLDLNIEEDNEAAIGDAFTIIAGCDKSFRSCREKFSNSLNFRGFPHLPGNDEAYVYANGNQNFDGRPIIE